MWLRHPLCCQKDIYGPWSTTLPHCQNIGNTSWRIIPSIWFVWGTHNWTGVSVALCTVPSQRSNKSISSFSSQCSYRKTLQEIMYEIHVTPCWGDEIDALGDNYMFLLWTSDSSPFLTNSVASRFPIAVVPASRYAMSESGVNMTLEGITQRIVSSFNTLSRSGVKIRNSDAHRNQPVTGSEYSLSNFPYGFF